MRTVAILQARMNSTRLPKKIILPLAGHLLVDQVYTRTSRATRLDRTIVAIPKGDYNAIRFDEAQTQIPFNDFFFYDGDEQDLVGRYLAAATISQADLIVRIPCDNPCVDPYFIDESIERYLSGSKIFQTNTTVYIDGAYYDGVGAEVFSLSRLKWLNEATQGHAQYREHPHLWFYEHLWDIYPPQNNDTIHPTVRLDVNTQEDYEFIKSIYDHFGHNRFTTDQVIGYLNTRRTHAPHQEQIQGSL